MIAGINPVKEKHLSSLTLALQKGSFLNENSGNCLYMGSKLVKKLNLNIDNEYDTRR